jgi:hypothetical protein
MIITDPKITSLSQAENHPMIGIRPAIDGRSKGIWVR